MANAVEIFQDGNVWRARKVCVRSSGRHIVREVGLETEIEQVARERAAFFLGVPAGAVARVDAPAQIQACAPARGRKGGSGRRWWLEEKG
jgi:hypothetical protein